MNKIYTICQRVLFVILLMGSFALSTVAQPVIDSVSPNSAPVGTSVVIYGHGFDAVAVNNIVSFGGVKATVTGGSSTTLSVLVPYSAQYAGVSVLNSLSKQTGSQKGLFLPVYDNSCYISGTDTFKAKINQTITGLNTANPQPRHATIGDVDGDGKPDLIVSTYLSGTPGQGALNIFLNNSSVNGILSYNPTPYICTTSNGGVNVKLADLDGDGKLDIVVAASGSGRISCLRNISTGTGMSGLAFASTYNLNPRVGPSEVAIADFDADGLPDIAVVTYDTSNYYNVKVFRNTITAPIASGGFSTGDFGPGGLGTYDSFAIARNNRFGNPATIAFGDFDGDGKFDLVTSNTSDSTISILRNTSTGVGNINFANHIDYVVGVNPTEVITAEINGDNAIDLVVGYYGDGSNSGGIVVYKNNSTSGNINFTPSVFAVGGSGFNTGVYAVAAGDLNGDGKVDIAGSKDIAHSVAVLQNNSTVGTIAMNAPKLLNTGIGASNQGVTINDIDGDNKPDIIVANIGLNTISIFENIATPDTNSIIGTTDSVCVNAQMNVHSHHCAGAQNFWTIAGSHATIVAGANDSTATITGVSAGIDTVVLKVAYLSDTNYVRYVINVKALADTGNIVGPTSVCTGASMVLTNIASGGIWTSSDPSKATIDTNGVVTITGVAVGSTIISYTNSSFSCGNLSAQHVVTVNLTPNGGTISGASGNCVGGSVTLTASVPGGVWNNVNTSIATMVASGITATLTGNVLGSDSVLYIVTAGSCSDTVQKVLGFIAPSPSSPSLPIGGITNVCVNSSVFLTNGLSGGTWSTVGTSGAATINATTGELFGVSAAVADTMTIRYSVSYGSCGSADTFTLVHINPLPVSGTVTGSNFVYLGYTTTLTTTGASGFNWSSSVPSVATVTNTTPSAIVTGLSLGTTIISYTVSNSCGFASDTQSMAVLAVPTAPTITSVTPSFGIPLVTTVTIGGTGFDASALPNNNNIVFFGAVRGNVISSTPTTLTVTLPLGANYSSISYLNALSLFACNQVGFFLPTYDYGCYIPDSSTFKPRVDMVVASPFAPGGSAPRHANLGDVDGDGKPDLVVCTYNTTTPGLGAVNIYRNIGTPGSIIYDVPVVCTTSNGGVNLKLADLDGDGKLDIIVACSGSGRVSCLRNTSTGIGNISFSAKRDLNPGSGPSEVAIADYDGDGKLDIAVVTRVTSNFKVFRNQMTSIPSGIFPANFFGSSATQYDSFAIGSTAPVSSGSIFTADFDGNGAADIVVSNTQDDNISVFRNISSGTGNINFTAHQDIATGGVNPSEVQAADINGDNLPEIVVGNYTSHNVTVFENTSSLGSLSFTPNLYSIAGTPYSMGLGDFDGDGKVDVVFGEYTSDKIEILHNNHSGLHLSSTSFQVGNTYLMAAGAEPHGLIVGDIDGDKKPDVVVANFAGNTISTFKNTSTPQINPIAGTTDSVCVSSSITLHSPHCAGSTGYWSTTQGHASVASGLSDTTGIVTGLSAGADTVVYTVVYLADSNTVRFPISVKALADTGIITGPAAVCVNATITLSDTTTGGIWSSINMAVATVDAVTGVVHALASGVTTILYTTQSFSCGPLSASHVVTVNALPDAGTITASASGVCAGTSMTLSNPVTGGTWINLHPAIATISTASATVQNLGGVVPGNDTILYVATTATCGNDTASVAIMVIPAAAAHTPITGTFTFCQNDSSALSNAVAGGTWSTSNNTVATVDPVTGIVHGIAAGSDTVRYLAIYPCTTLDTFVVITVNPLPALVTVTGATSLCVSATTTLINTGAGGAWTSSNNAVATVNGSGVVFGVSGGNVIITYTITNSCGTNADTQSIVVNALPNITAVAGASAICLGGSTTLSTGGGVSYSWSPSAGLNSTTGTPITASPATGTSYTVTGTDINGCTNTNSVNVAVNAIPTVTATAGTATICAGTNTTLQGSGASTYVWTPATDITATTGAVVTFTGTNTTTYSVTGTDINGCVGTGSVTVTVNIVPTVTATSGVTTMCAGNSTTLGAFGATTYSWSPATDLSASTGATVTFNGTNTATYTVTGSSLGCSSTATVTVTVNPLPNITANSGSASVCVGSSTTLSANGGVSYTWSPSATLSASTGTPVTATPAAATTYTVTGIDINGCSNANTVTVGVNTLPTVSAAAGTGTICAGNTTTLQGAGANTYVWSPASDISATTGAVVTFTGTNTASYTVTGTDINGCTGTGSVTVTVNPVPTVIATPGTAAICTGTTTTLGANGATSYTWTPATNISASTGATVTFSGTNTATYTVTGVSAGCSGTATVSVTVNPLPTVTATPGSFIICAGTNTTIAANGANTYVWTPGTDLSASTGTPVTFSGSVTTAYTVTGTDLNGCSADASLTISVNPLPNAGTITGTASVCVGATTTLTNTTAGGAGTWSMANANATISSAGIVTGVTAGADIAYYTYTNSCGTDVDTFAMTVTPLPFADTITGANDSMCIGSTMALTDPVAGGVWSSVNTTIATISATGVVTPVAAGVDTIRYIYTNTCGSDTAIYPITVIATPTVSVVGGPDSVCVNATIVLTNTTIGGVWTSTDTTIAKIDSVTGTVIGIAQGVVVMHYTYTNFCGFADTTDTVYVNPLPFADTIHGGVDSVCIGTSLTLTDPAIGGVWSTSAPTVVSINSSGIATALSAGTAIITYAVTNSCGTAYAVDTIVVNPTPALTSALTQTICSGTPFNYTPSGTPPGVSFSWTRAVVPNITNAAGAGIGSIGETLTSTDTLAVNVIYVYSVSANGCSSTQNLTVKVNPLPTLSSDTSIIVCSGSPILYFAKTGVDFTVFAWTRPAVAGITPATASGSFVINETLTNVPGVVTIPVSYVFTLTASGCVNTQTVHVNVEPAPPAPPQITTMSPPFLCAGTMYQNFGAGIIPPTGINYVWSSYNAQVWATGSTDQYCLVNFTNPGMSWVYLTSNVNGFTCTSRDSFAVIVSNDFSDHPDVWYFNTDFVCSPSDEGTYQWGYDDASTLDSTLLSGETNQNYYNPSPDFVGKYYWVITTRHGCMQKTYYKTPTGIKNVTNGGVTDVKIYPNPNNGNFSVNVTSDYTEQGVLTVTNIMGQKVMEANMMTNRKIDLQLNNAAGIYFVNVSTPHGKFTGKVTITGNN